VSEDSDILLFSTLSSSSFLSQPLNKLNFLTESRPPTSRAYRAVLLIKHLHDSWEQGLQGCLMLIRGMLRISLSPSRKLII
jgi:hypothetical protein